MNSPTKTNILGLINSENAVITLTIDKSKQQKVDEGVKQR